MVWAQTVLADSDWEVVQCPSRTLSGVMQREGCRSGRGPKGGRANTSRRRDTCLTLHTALYSLELYTLSNDAAVPRGARTEQKRVCEGGGKVSDRDIVH